MIRRCRMCNRPMKVGLLDWLTRPVMFCPPKDVTGCIATYRAMTEEPPEDEPEHPDRIPPHDIDVCPRCTGDGAVMSRRDWSTGAYEYTACGLCRGTGQVGAETFA